MSSELWRRFVFLLVYECINRCTVYMFVRQTGSFRTYMRSGSSSSGWKMCNKLLWLIYTFRYSPKQTHIHALFQDKWALLWEWLFPVSHMIWWYEAYYRFSRPILFYQLIVAWWTCENGPFLTPYWRHQSLGYLKKICMPVVNIYWCPWTVKGFKIQLLMLNFKC